jgi:RNA polymerase sigma-70 factor (sigma-E family)
MKFRKRRRSGFSLAGGVLARKAHRVQRTAEARRLDAVQAVAPIAPLDVRAEVLLDGLYRTHAPGAVRFALMLTGDRALSEDLVQEAFVRVAAKLSNLRDPSAFGAYLTRAVANLAKSHFRHQEVAKRHDRAVDASTLVVAPVDVATNDALLVALRRLPMQQRAALVLRYYDDLSHEEIARVLDCPVGTVKSQLSRGLARLRKECRDA